MQGHDLPLLNGWQRGFPLCAAPFDVLGQALGRSSSDVIATCQRLRDAGVLGRIGAVFAPGAFAEVPLATRNELEANRQANQRIDEQVGPR